MLFNSLPFLLIFMPVVVFGYWVVRGRSLVASSAFLAAASLVFYGVWTIEHIPILASSIAVNFTFGYLISVSDRWARTLAILGISGNLGGLAWYKYAGFVAENIEAITGLPIGSIDAGDLPIGISFFTFTQIAYLVDTYQRKVSEQDPINYTLFVSYFPHLIAGPILHHREMMPQFANRSPKYIPPHIAVGLAVFVLGLVKKVVLADPIGEIAFPLFSASDGGQSLSVVDAWVAALAFTLKLYFDFSAYCDMACGVSFMLGIKLPINFWSPYKATSIIDFWRRWHMTLSRFLRDYLYIPLGGSHRGEVMRYRNLAITMLLGGIWHGAAWTFVVWGALHGSYLIVNHLFRDIGGRLPAPLGWALTFLAVIVGWVFFRAGSLPSAVGMIWSMAGQATLGTVDIAVAAHIAALLAIALVAPNVYQIVSRYEPALLPKGVEAEVKWASAPKIGVATGTLLGVAMFACVFIISRTSVPTEFLYFQF